MRIVAADDFDELDGMRALLLAEGGAALLMHGTEGEAFVNPRRRPRIELIRDGGSRVLYEQEPAHEECSDVAEADVGARATAAWIRRVLEGQVALPQPIINQLACCLYASGHSADLNQAKAIVAVETRSLTAA
jgi:anthranilate phosphoribosyltransferase